MADATNTAAAASPGFFSGIGAGLQSLLTTGANIYGQVVSAKGATDVAKLQAQQAANLTALNATAANQAAASSGLWYKQAWVMPAAIVAGLLLVGGLFFASRRRRG